MCQCTHPVVDFNLISVGAGQKLLHRRSSHSTFSVLSSRIPFVQVSGNINSETFARRTAELTPRPRPRRSRRPDAPADVRSKLKFTELMLISGDSFEPFYSFKYGRLLICMHYKFMPPFRGAARWPPFFAL